MKFANIKTTKIYQKILIAFCIITVIIICLIIYFSFSKTVVTVTLNQKEVKTSFNIDVKKEIPEADTEKNVLKGNLIVTTLKQTKTFENGNEGKEVEAQATGKVTIYNNWSKVQPLAATTRLLTPDGILFRIKNRIDVPANGKLENVDVYADKLGASGNINSTKFTIPGLSKELQEKIYAESFEPMTGGVVNAKVVTQENINEAKKELISQMEKDVIPEFEKMPEVIEKQLKILPQAITYLILEDKSSVVAGTEAVSYDITLNLKFIAVIFDENELLNKSIDKLKEVLTIDEQLKSYDKNSLTYKIAEYNIDNQQATLSVNFSGQAILKLSSQILSRDKIAGKDEQEIKTYYSGYEEIKSADIKFSPFWVTRAPTLKDHIEIKVIE